VTGVPWSEVRNHPIPIDENEDNNHSEKTDGFLGCAVTGVLGHMFHCGVSVNVKRLELTRR
jgi:hypothetical protein